MSPEVIVQKWGESERGMGDRPDGYSLHLTETDRVTFIEKYWEKMPDEVPDTYSRPSGTPYTTEIDEQTFEKVRESGHGVRFRSNNYPGSGGPDGWVNVRTPPPSPEIKIAVRAEQPRKLPVKVHIS